jgi:lipopolysaccharide export system protein LptA
MLPFLQGKQKKESVAIDNLTIDSGEMEFDDNKKQAKASKDVVVNSKTKEKKFHMTCDFLLCHMNAQNNIESIKANSNIVINVKDQKTGDRVTVFCDESFYDTKKNHIDFSGNVKIINKDYTAFGSKGWIDLNDSTAKIFSEKNNPAKIIYACLPNIL